MHRNEHLAQQQQEQEIEHFFSLCWSHYSQNGPIYLQV